MFNSDPPEILTPDERAVERVVAAGPRGALTLAEPRNRYRGCDLARILSLRFPAARRAAMTVQDSHHEAAATAAHTERQWAIVSIVIVVAVTLYGGRCRHPSRDDAAGSCRDH